MARIFISYRRDDSMADAFLIYERLREAFGEEVFWDIQSLGAGVKFISEIIDAVNQIDAMVVVIGKQWLSITDTNGRPRLEDPNDILRTEIATALARDVLVIPLLIGGATLPSKSDLPENLKTLTDHNALAINYSSFDHDISRVIRSIEQQLNISKALNLTQEAIRPKPKQIPFIPSEVELASFFGFSLEELELNRKGKLSNSQIAYLTTTYRTNLKASLKVIGGSGLLLIPFLIIQSSTNTIGVLSLFFGGLGLVIGTIILFSSTIGLKTSPSVAAAVGILGYYSNGKSISIGKKQFTARRQLLRTPNSPPAGLVYFVYHANGTIMSVDVAKYT